MGVPLLRNYLYIVISLVASNFFGYLFHAVVSRRLGPSLYGEFSVLYAFMITLSVPLTILSGAITRVAVTGRMAGYDINRISRFAWKSGILLALVLSLGPLVLSPWIAPFLNVTGGSLFVPLAITLMLWGLAAVMRGMFSSVEAFGILAGTGTAELLVRAAAGMALVIAGFGIAGALWSSCAGALVLLVLLRTREGSMIAEYERLKGADAENEGFSTITAKVFLIAIPTALFLELDLLLARRYFSPEDAGIFAAVALLGKGLVLFSSAASSVIFPRLVKERLSREGMRFFLWGVFAAVMLLGAGGIAMAFIGEGIVNILFGKQYHRVIDLAPYYIISVMPLAVHLQVTSYKGAIGGWVEGIWLWSVLAVYCIALDLSSGTFASYLMAILLVHAISAPVSFYILYLRHRNDGLAYSV